MNQVELSHVQARLAFILTELKQNPSLSQTLFVKPGLGSLRNTKTQAQLIKLDNKFFFFFF